jgi:soluble lytic murein transglycosylase-like protein
MSGPGAAFAAAQVRVTRTTDGRLLLSNEARPATAPRPVTAPQARAPRGPSVERSEIDRLVDRYATDHGLDPLLVRALIEVESGYDSRAVSHKGALGLMQLMPQTAAELAVPNPFDPEANVRGGTTYLRRMLDTFDDQLPLALAGYNAGPAAVVRYGGIPPYQETQQYVRKVLELYTGEELTELPAPEGRQTFLIRRDGRLLMTTSPPERR